MSYGQRNRERGLKPLYCSFCGKSDREVKKLVAGVDALICDECIRLAMTLIDGNENAQEQR